MRKITITKDGPYKVSVTISLNHALIMPDERGGSEKWAIGKPYKTQSPDYYLCRCGRSEGKPFCDGSHQEVHFHGTETADRPPYIENAQHLEGSTLDLLDDKSLCAVARFCDRQGTIWRQLGDTDQPGIEAEVVREACRCPSGRLTAVTKEGQHLEPHLPQEISTIEDIARNWRGPLWVKGGIAIEGPQGEVYEVRNRVTLCRCGESKNMPYCDAAHYHTDHMKGMDP